MADGVKRIRVGKNDSLEEVLRQLSKTRNSSVVLYIPRGAELVKEAKHLSELYAHAKSLGKELSIESVDEEVLAMASLVGITAGNSFYAKRPRQVADILPRRPEKVEALVANYSAEDEEKKSEETEIKRKREPQKRTSRPALAKIAIPAVLAVAAAYYCVAILPSAAVTVDFHQTPWNFTGQMTIDANATQVSMSNNAVTVPGKLFDVTKTMTQIFTASGSRYVQTKAAGTVTVYNNFSTAPQTLVATTRLVDSQGTMFRLDKTIVVPGAKISGGKLVPSQIDAAVTAAAPGSQYDITAGQVFHMPGFAGTKRYDGFYAENSQAMSGGFIGQTKAPSPSDLSQATSSIASALENAIASEVALQAPPGTKFIDGGSSFAVAKYDINDVPNNNGQFAVTAYGEYKTIGFNENDLVTAMASQVADNFSANLSIKTYSVTYGTPKIDWKNKVTTVPVAFQSSWEPSFDANSFRQEVAGKNQSQIKSLILALPQVQSSEIKFWPFWVQTAPGSISKITIDTN